ncbi:MAG: hypothetical protein II295_00315, partial [Akkermansia sp.]|nr:hypothetical protein [Akkermansia sp.]
FGNIVSAIYSRLENNKKETQKLQDKRDFLLPLLMNGQIQVKPLNYRLSLNLFLPKGGEWCLMGARGGFGQESVKIMTPRIFLYPAVMPGSDSGRALPP